MRKILLVLLSFCMISTSWAIDLEKMIGKPLNDKELHSFISQLEGKRIESFLPFRKAYILSYPKEGIELEFNSNMSLYQVSLYDSGFTFFKFKGELPYSVKWGMDSVGIQAKNGILNSDPQNQFKKYYSNEKYYTYFYFKSNRLEHIKLIATEQHIIESSEKSMTSWGFRLFPDGKAVKGNVLDGEGMMVWGSKAAAYDGEWSYGLPHGIGVYTDSLGNKYAGEFKLGFFWGAGSYYSSYYNYTYDGQFVMGKRHGKGSIVYDNGIKYDGDWVQNDMEGVGQYTLNATYYYQGEMKANQFHGKGVLTTPDGYIKGKFKNGKPHGYCEQYGNQSGQTLKGYWKDGKKEGEFTMTSFGYERKMFFENDIEIVKPNSEN